MAQRLTVEYYSYHGYLQGLWYCNILWYAVVMFKKKTDMTQRITLVYYSYHGYLQGLQGLWYTSILDRSRFM
jgi:hypothetical protein